MCSWHVNNAYIGRDVHVIIEDTLLNEITEFVFYFCVHIITPGASPYMHGSTACWRKSNEKKMKVFILMIFNVIIYFRLGLDNWIKIKCIQNHNQKLYLETIWAKIARPYICALYGGYLKKIIVQAWSCGYFVTQTIVRHTMWLVSNCTTDATLYFSHPLEYQFSVF